MILGELKRFLMARRQASLADLAAHFDAEPDALRGMLEHWVRKNKVRRFKAEAACGSGCCKCEPTSVEFYEWCG